jgi:hypothetical protein
MNLTPDQLIVAAIDIPSARLATQPVIIEAGQTGAMPLADDQAFYHYVFSPSMPELGVLPIGVVNNGSQPVVLLHSEMFYPAVDEEGKVVERLQGELEALQFYPGEYAPQWNTFEIYNRTTNVIRVTAMSVDPRAPDVPQSRILEPHQLTRIVGFTGLQVELGVEYVGGASPALDPGFRFMNDSAADLRILVIEEDPKDARKVNILTRQAPMVRLKPIEVRLPDALRPVYLVGQTDQRTRSRR